MGPAWNEGECGKGTVSKGWKVAAQHAQGTVWSSGGWGGVWGPHPKGPECQTRELRPLPAGAGEPREVLGQGRGTARAPGPQMSLEEDGEAAAGGRPGADTLLPPPPWQLLSLTGQWGVQGQGPSVSPPQKAGGRPRNAIKQSVEGP